MKDRLAEIEREWAHAENGSDKDDVQWLIAEVKRLRHIHCECEYSEPCPNEAEVRRLRAWRDLAKKLQELYRQDYRSTELEDAVDEVDQLDREVM